MLGGVKDVISGPPRGSRNDDFGRELPSMGAGPASLGNSRGSLVVVASIPEWPIPGDRLTACRLTCSAARLTRFGVPRLFCLPESSYLSLSLPGSSGIPGDLISET